MSFEEGIIWEKSICDWCQIEAEKANQTSEEVDCVHFETTVDHGYLCEHCLKAVIASK